MSIHETFTVGTLKRVSASLMDIDDARTRGFIPSLASAIVGIRRIKVGESLFVRTAHCPIVVGSDGEIVLVADVQIKSQVHDLIWTLTEERIKPLWLYILFAHPNEIGRFISQICASKVATTKTFKAMSERTSLQAHQLVMIERT